jgi:glycosyltransferase involved in cell wall biosynthesis
MPLMPMAVEFFDLRAYDVVLSSTSSFAKGVITSPDTLHICYCHTPTRYVWSDTHQYINELKYNKYLKKIISLILNYVRIWDRQAADRVDVFIANSRTVQKRIKKYYRRNSHIIYPSIEEEKFNISSKVGDYFLAGSRLVPYKRIDIVIQACRELGLKLKVFGDGIDMPRLKEIAGDDSNIELLGRVSDEERQRLFSECRAYINPQREDFGITIVEAMASGRPVIALGQGGATETIKAGETGEFFSMESQESLQGVLKSFDHSKYDPQLIRQHALKFSKENFKKQVREFVEGEYGEFKKGV